MSIETITLGAGCFWCIENIVALIRGVVAQMVIIINPSYEQVCNGTASHVEVPTQLSVEQILTVFFAIHDPATINRQGVDIVD
jgi:peptide-methionine (S)-S-oxide reductase